MTRLLSCVVGLSAAFAASAQSPAPPSEIYGEFFDAVQMSHVFADSKQFPDAVPRSDPADILARWRAQRTRADFSLANFVEESFQPEPSVATLAPQSDRRNLAAHIARLWKVLSRSMTATTRPTSLLPLPHPAIVPGGRFREVYYWDSYFTLLGVAISGEPQMLTNMVENFAFLIDTYGHVPNGTRSYYLSRSQPPFFYETVALTAPQDPSAAWAKYLPELRREYAFWMEGEGVAKPGQPHRRVVALADGSHLNRYWDDRPAPRDEAYAEDVALARASKRPSQELYRDIRAAAESGWDFSSRWLADGRALGAIQTADIVPVDLNSLLFGLEAAIRQACERVKDDPCVKEFAQRGVDRRRAVDRYLWDANAGVFGDYDWRTKSATQRFSAASLYSLFTGLAGETQARSIAKFAERELLHAGGLAATSIATGQQWDLPNGWAPLQWIAVRGLRSYGETALAGTIAQRWLANVTKVYCATGRLVEKYDVVDLDRPGGGGEYPLQDGFGWTNGVTAQLLQLYPTDKEDCR